MVEALRWALALGAVPGRQGSNERADGVDKKRLRARAELFTIDGGSSLQSHYVEIQSMAEPALLMRDRKTCLALRDMGWVWPRKARVKEMRAELEELLKQSGRRPLRSVWSGELAGADFPAAFMAFWERLDLARALPDPESERSPSARRPRI